MLVDWGTLSARQTIGQTFVAEYEGLAGIYFYLSPQNTGNGSIRLHLRSAPEAPDDLALSLNTITVEGIKAPGYYGFFVPAQGSSNQRYYYAFLEVTGSGEIQVGKAGGDTYLNGAIYKNGMPEDAQAAFQLSYSRRKSIMGLGWEAVILGGILVIGFFLFILPGWGLFSLLWPGWGGITWPEKLGLSAGLSLALYPLLLLWTDIIGVHLGALYAWLPSLAGLGIIIWRNRKRLSFRTFPRAHALMFHWSDAVLVGLLVLIILTRFWAIRLLEAPQWGDSVQHTVMTQLMLNNGGLFKSWVPYTPYNSLTVQFGFPVFTALFSWITGLSSIKATLIVGQIVNGLAVLALYPLALRITKGNRWAGIGAVLAAGLLSPMPAFYVNWGRYAQLAGQAILPVALWLVWEALTFPSSLFPVRKIAGQGRGAIIGLSALALAGMMLTYYRMPFYYASFILALLAGLGLPEWRLNWRIWAKNLGILLVVAVLAGLLFLPWGLRLFGSNLAGAVEAGVTSVSSVEAVLTDYRIWHDLFWYVPEPLLFLALAGVVWSLARKRWMVAAQGLWVACLTAVIAARLIHLPGANMMQNFAILIALYIPIGLVFGWIIAEIAGPGNGKLRQILVATAVFMVAILGALAQRNIAFPATYAYLTRPDSRAMAWIRGNLPEDALFLVEGYGIYGGTTIVGGDAGWWMPLLAQRQNTMPPQYAILNESPIQPDYTQRMVDLVNSLETVSLDSEEGTQLLCREGITHIYIGQGQGKVGLNVIQLFSPDELLKSERYNLLYHQDRVYVFALKLDTCP